MLNLDSGQFRTASVSGLMKGAGAVEFWWWWGGGADVCARESGGQRRMVSFRWGAAEYFTVMDVPHGDPVSDAFGARWGALSEVRGRLSALLHSPLSLWEKCKGSCGSRKDSSTWA